MSLNDKWVDGILTQENVQGWIYRQKSSQQMSHEEIKHVGMCMHHIYQWHMKVDDRPGLGHFLTAVVRNDFMEACVRADDANAKALVLYAKFIRDNAPLDWKIQPHFAELRRNVVAQSHVSSALGEFP